jgi:hypothetical protein
MLVHGFDFGKMVFAPACMVKFAEAGERRSKAVHHLPREECNKYDLTVAPCF